MNSVKAHLLDQKSNLLQITSNMIVRFSEKFVILKHIVHKWSRNSTKGKTNVLWQRSKDTITSRFSSAVFYLLG